MLCFVLFVYKEMSLFLSSFFYYYNLLHLNGCFGKRCLNTYFDILLYIGGWGKRNNGL